MIFTSYFANIKKFPKNVIPVAICAKVPDWYKGIRYSKLAPNYDILMKYKDDHNEADYIKRFNNTTLADLNPVKVSFELQDLLGSFHDIYLVLAPLCDNPSYHIALVCYEKPGDFCHRHLVADWFRRNGIECEEWENDG